MSRFEEGQKVMRYLSAARIPMPMIVTRVHEGLVHCAAWTFDDETGVEEDPELGYGRSFGRTGSIIEEVPEDVWEQKKRENTQRLIERVARHEGDRHTEQGS